MRGKNSSYPAHYHYEFEPRGKYQPDAIEKTIAYCRAHYLEPDLSREMTADALGYNRSYL